MRVAVALRIPSLPATHQMQSAVTHMIVTSLVCCACAGVAGAMAAGRGALNNFLLSEGKTRFFGRHAPAVLRGAGLPDRGRGRAILLCVTDIIKWCGRDPGAQADRRRGGLARSAQI